jgi:hypothetical protein
MPVLTDIFASASPASITLFVIAASAVTTPVPAIGESHSNAPSEPNARLAYPIEYPTGIAARTVPGPPEQLRLALVDPVHLGIDDVRTRALARGARGAHHQRPAFLQADIGAGQRVEGRHGDAAARALLHLQRAGAVVGVDVGFEDVCDRELVLAGQLDVHLDIPPGVDDGCLAGRLVADQVRQVGHPFGENCFHDHCRICHSTSPSKF